MSRKVAVVACFAPRLLVVAVALVRAVYLYQVTPHENPEYDLWVTVICTQVHVCASICTACVPYMVPFFKSLQGNIWRSYSARSRTLKCRSSHPLGQSPNRLRKREANIHFESARSFASLVKEPERVSIISPRIPSPGPISPFLPPPISTLQMTPITRTVSDFQHTRTLTAAETVHDSEYEEVFDMVGLQTAMCFVPSPLEPAAQASLSSGTAVDFSEPLEYLLLCSPDLSRSSSCYSSRASTLTQPPTNSRFSLFPQDTPSNVLVQPVTQKNSSSGRQSLYVQHTTSGEDSTHVTSSQELPYPTPSHGFNDYAHPARSASSRSHIKFSTTPRLNAPPSTILPTTELTNP